MEAADLEERFEDREVKIKAGEPFRFNTESGVVLWTGYVAEDLPSLLEGLREVPTSSIYYHVHHAVFQRPKYTVAEYTHDFARWVFRELGQKGLAEKLSCVDPLECGTVGRCADELVACVEPYVGDNEVFPRVPQGHEFYFLEARSFIVATQREAHDVRQLAEIIGQLGPSSMLYHFVESRFRNADGVNDFSRWMRARGETEKASALERLNPYFYDPNQLKNQIVEVLSS